MARAESEIVSELRQAEDRHDELVNALEKHRAEAAEADALLAKHDSEHNAERAVAARSRVQVTETRVQSVASLIARLEAELGDPALVAEREAAAQRAAEKHAADEATLAAHRDTPRTIVELLKQWEADIRSTGRSPLRTMTRPLFDAMRAAGVSPHDVRDLFRAACDHF